MKHKKCYIYTRVSTAIEEADIELQIEEAQMRLFNVQQQRITEENVYQFLLYFDQLYSQFNDGEKKEFMSSFIKAIQIFGEAQSDGRILKSIRFRFPVFFNGEEYEEIRWDSENIVETVICLSKDEVNAK